MTVAGRSVVGFVLAVVSLAGGSVADAQVYTAAKTGGNYMHNYYLPPAASSTPWWPSWSPDGKRIAFAMDGSIWRSRSAATLPGARLLRARIPVVARVLARRPLARLHRRRRRQEHQPARGQPGHRCLDQPHDRHAGERRAGVVAGRQAPGLRLHRAQRLLQRVRDGGDRRQGRRDHPGDHRQRLRPRAALLQPDRRPHLAGVVARRQGTAAGFQPQHPARLGRHLAGTGRRQRDGVAGRQGDSQGGDALPHPAAVVT